MTTAIDPAAWISSAVSREATGDYSDTKLGPISAAVAALPQPPARPITVAGTKGKGSSVRLLETMLLANDQQTLAFTSPHVHDLRERWRVNGLPIDTATWATAAATARDAEAASGQALTYFERCFLIATALSAMLPEAWFLCEVGLGGRLDCANALDAQAVILSHLSLDHCHVLGDTLNLIAGEKLGVARPGVPLLVAAQSPEAAAAISERMPAGVTPTWTEPLAWPCGLPGDHQHGNIATAWAVTQWLLPAPDLAATQAAVANVTLAARCQWLPQVQGRDWLIDGAHNPPSVAATLAVARQCFGDRWLLVLGLAADKDAEGISAVCASAPQVWRCGYAGERARQADQWPAAANLWPFFSDISAVLADLPPDLPVVVCGSFYLAGEALAALGQAGLSPG